MNTELMVRLTLNLPLQVLAARYLEREKDSLILSSVSLALCINTLSFIFNSVPS
jgi:hypothetical protein